VINISHKGYRYISKTKSQKNISKRVLNYFSRKISPKRYKYISKEILAAPPAGTSVAA